MSFSKNVFLRDGNEVLIKSLTGKEDVREFQNFINTITGEDSHLLLDKPLTLKEEKIWLKNQIQANRKGVQIYLKALTNGHLIGVCNAQRGIYRNRGNVNIGVALEKNWRGRGLGRVLLMEIITLAEKKWHPKNIYLHVASPNRTALALYRSLDFRTLAKLPQWFEYKGKYCDEFILILDKKFYRQEWKKYYC